MESDSSQCLPGTGQEAMAIHWNTIKLNKNFFYHENGQALNRHCVAETLNPSWNLSLNPCAVPTLCRAHPHLTGCSLSLGADQLLLWFWALQAVVQTPTMMIIIKPVLSNDFTTSSFYSVVFPCYLSTDVCDFFFWSITLSVLTSSYPIVFLYQGVFRHAWEV